MNLLFKLTDTQLVDEFKNGNNQALEVLVCRHKKKIFSSILFLVKDKYLAEDIFQDTFIKIINTVRKNTYSEEGKFLPYAICIAHNLCIDHFRKIRRAPVVKTGDNEFLKIFNPAAETADKDIIQLQTSDRVRQLLDKLPEEQREVIVLRHFADLSFKEIAEMTNCSINTALGRMRYALINMRQIVEEKQIAL